MFKSSFKYTLLLLLLITAGCAYYNTFFNAKHSFHLAEEKQKISKSTELAADVRKEYERAINKSWKLIDFYGDSSSYADDALLLIGQAHYNLAEFAKSERVLEQFLLKYLKSDLLPEAKLWLAKTYIALEKQDKAQELLDNLFRAKVSKKIAAQAFYILGDLFYKQDNFRKAIEYLEKCVDITSDDEIEGAAQFLIGEAFFELEEYENAVYAYEKLEKLNIPVIKEYEAFSQKVNALSKMEKYGEAEQELREMLRNQRFNNQFALIETKLANIFEQQGETDLARDYYYDIMKKYPRSEGVGLTAFYLGQLYELVYGNFDSAKVYYDKAGKLKTEKIVLEEASKKSQLLTEYLKMRDQLRKDRSDLRRLVRGDSSLVDSMDVTSESGQKKQEQLQAQQNTAQEDLSDPLKNAQSFEMISDSDSIRTSVEDSTQQEKTQKSKQKAPTTKKVAVNRTPEEVNDSYIKNSFARGEFFLLKYLNYDSAAVAYQEFVTHFQDSLLTPKAYYAMYFIYKTIEDSIKADSIKTLIIDRYPSTSYGQKLSSQVYDLISADAQSEDKIYRDKYLKAENNLFSQNFEKAIQLFGEIAISDSGSVWAKKSRYAIAYIYEKYLNDFPRAIDNYTILAKEYPNTEYSKIAQNKIQPPKEEVNINEVTRDKPDQQLEDFSDEVIDVKKLKKIEDPSLGDEADQKSEEEAEEEDRRKFLNKKNTVEQEKTKPDSSQTELRD